MNSNAAYDLPSNIERLRKAKGWKEAELARRADIAYQLFGRLREGSDAYVASAVKLAKAFDVTLDELVLGRPPDIDDALPGWSQLTDEQRASIVTIVSNYLQASGKAPRRPRGSSTPQDRRAIDETGDEADDDQGLEDDD